MSGGCSSFAIAAVANCGSGDDPPVSAMAREGRWWRRPTDVLWRCDAEETQQPPDECSSSSSRAKGRRRSAPQQVGCMVGRAWPVGGAVQRRVVSIHLPLFFSFLRRLAAAGERAEEKMIGRMAMRMWRSKRAQASRQQSPWTGRTTMRTPRTGPAARTYLTEYL